MKASHPKSHMLCRCGGKKVILDLNPKSHRILLFFWLCTYPLVPIIGPETKGWNLLSRTTDPGSKTGTKGSCEPGQKANSPLVVGNSMFPIYSNITKKSLHISICLCIVCHEKR